MMSSDNSKAEIRYTCDRDLGSEESVAEIRVGPEEFSQFLNDAHGLGERQSPNLHFVFVDADGKVVYDK